MSKNGKNNGETTNSESQENLENSVSSEEPSLEDINTNTVVESPAQVEGSKGKQNQKGTPKAFTTVRVRVNGHYNYLHPASNKMVTSEFKDFTWDSWLEAQLSSNLIVVQAMDGTPLRLVGGKLVKAA